MKCTIELTKSMFQDLDPYSFKILIYCKVYFDGYEKLPSMREIGRKLNISFPKVKESIIKLHSYLNLAKKTDTASHTYIYNIYKFIIPLTSLIYNSYISSNKISVTSKEEKIWNRILSFAEKNYDKSLISKRYYWRTISWLKHLLKSINENEIDNYIEWYFRIKTKEIPNFSAGIFCCSPMIGQYLNEKKKVNKRKISAKKSSFIDQSEKEEKKILASLLERKEKNQLDKYDEELLKYFKKKDML